MASHGGAFPSIAKAGKASLEGDIALQQALASDPNWRILIQDEDKIVSGVEMTLKHLWVFAGWASHDHTASLVFLAKAWKRNESLFTQQMNATLGFENLQQSTAASGPTEHSNELDTLVSYMESAVCFREDEAGMSEDEIRAFNETHTGEAERISIGIKIMEMVYAITPKSLFGLFVLVLMGMTAQRIASMDDDHRRIFMGIMTPGASVQTGSRHRGVPSWCSDVVDHIVDGIIPMLEFTFCYNIRYCYEGIVSVFRNRLIAPPPEEHLYSFAVKSFGEYPDTPAAILHMPDLEVISGDFNYVKGETGFLTMSDGHIRLELARHEVRPEPTEGSWKKYRRFRDKFYVVRERYLDPFQEKYAIRLKRPEGVSEMQFGIIPQAIYEDIPQVLYWGGFADLKDLEFNHKILKHKFSSLVVYEQRFRNSPLIHQGRITAEYITRPDIESALLDKKGRVKLPDSSSIRVKSRIGKPSEATARKRKKLP